MATSALTRFGSGFTMSDTLSIVAKTKKLDVNNHLPLEYYYRTADSLLIQGRVYRVQGSVIDCYVVLLRFASLLAETIPEHRNYRLYDVEQKDYRRKLLNVITELEKLKPEVAEQVHRHNKAIRKAGVKLKSCTNPTTLHERECGICAEMKPSHSFISTKDCAHKYCTGCCKQHANVKILSGSSQIICPHPDCRHNFDIVQCRALLSLKQFDILNTRLTEAAIPVGQKVFCPFQDCSLLMEKSESSKSARNTFAACYSCHRGFCLECKVPWHANMSCGEYRTYIENRKQGGDQKLRDLATEKKWQVCPNYELVVELMSGCYHITCRCKTEFCYLCQKRWENKKPSCKCKLWDERNIIDHRQRVF
ncbi:hypothetical protein M758_5G066800 [Ceratodon purpureus]|nr:hypothetical protein M758_5G066800 [Ceratodon purpureus]